MLRGGIAPRGFFREGGVGSGATLRRQAETLANRAAELGLDDPDELLSHTPAEIERILRAHAVRQRSRMEMLDAAAWLTGRYAARALCDPKRYPVHPDGLVRPAMDAAAMKSVFAGMAARSPSKEVRGE